MKRAHVFRSPLPLFIALMMATGFFLLGSHASVDEADSQVVKELSAEIAQAEANLKALQQLKQQPAAFGYPTLGQIALFAGNFAPRGWALCDGQLLPIAQYQSLYSLLGTIYGGDGRTTFALPDLRGRVPVHRGQGPGLHDHLQGWKFGVSSTDIKTSKWPVSTDSMEVQVVTGFRDDVYVAQPGLGVNYIIALEGTFPSRS